jgi:RNA polymerase sigma-70 factor, ECF subfamily
MEPLEAPLAAYFYFHGAKGWLLQQLGRLDEAQAAFPRALGLARSAADAIQIRKYLDEISQARGVAP